MNDTLESDWENAIAFYCERILSDNDKPSKPLWHYTGAEGCEGIVSKGEIFATHYGFTNDSTELRHGEKVLMRVVEELAANEPNPVFREVYASLKGILPGQLLTDRADVYLACFTARGGNDVQQWSGYGYRGAGYSLRLKVAAPTDDPPGAEIAVMLVKVVYGDDFFEQMVRSQLARHAQVYAENKAAGGAAALSEVTVWMLRECASLTPRVKNKCFEHEEEWRLIVTPLPGNQREDRAKHVEFRKRNNTLVPYLRVALPARPVEMLVCGPSHAGEEAARLGGARLLLAKYDYPAELAKLSNAPFRG